MTRSPSPYTTKPGSSEIHCFAYLPTPRLAILLPLRSTNRPSSSSTSLNLSLAMLLLRCLGKGRKRDRWLKLVACDAIQIDEALAEENLVADADTHDVRPTLDRRDFCHRQIERPPTVVGIFHRVNRDDFIEWQRLCAGVPTIRR